MNGLPPRIHAAWSGGRVRKRMRCHGPGWPTVNPCGFPAVVHRWEILRQAGIFGEVSWFVVFSASCIDHVDHPLHSASILVSHSPWMPYEDAIRTLRESYDGTVTVASILGS